MNTCSLTCRKALRLEVHDAIATRARISSFYLGRYSPREYRRCWHVFLIVSAAELRNCDHPPRQRSCGSSPTGDIRALHFVHRRPDRSSSLARRATPRRDPRGPAKSRITTRWGQRGEQQPPTPPKKILNITSKPIVSHLAPAQLFSPYAKPGHPARIATYPTADPPPLPPSPCRASAQTVQKPAQKVPRGGRRVQRSPRGGRPRRATRYRALARGGARNRRRYRHAAYVDERVWWERRRGRRRNGSVGSRPTLRSASRAGSISPPLSQVACVCVALSVGFALINRKIK